MINLNVGNLWDDKYLDEVILLNGAYKDTIQVRSLFGSIARLTPTARAFDRLPERDWDFISWYVNKALENNIKIRYTLNQSCIGSAQQFLREWEGGLKKTIENLHAVGVDEWTVTSPLLIELLSDMFPDDFIEVSTIAEVSTPEDTRRWRELGAHGVNLSTSINRDFPALENAVDEGLLEVSLLANEACLFRCPWRRECYNLSSHNSDRSEELFGYYPFRRCTEKRLENPVEWLKARLILPQWLGDYQKAVHVNWFKIAYRTHPIETALPMLRAYMEQEFNGNLLDLWPTITHLGRTQEPRDVTFISVEKLDRYGFLDHFLGHGDVCSSIGCDKCRYCDTLYDSISKDE